MNLVSKTGIDVLRWTIPLRTYLLRQLNHLEIPRTQTLICVDGPVGNAVTSAASVTPAPRIKHMCVYIYIYTYIYVCIYTHVYVYIYIQGLPPEIKVLVHQLSQTLPVSVLKSRPEGEDILNL